MSGTPEHATKYASMYFVSYGLITTKTQSSQRGVTQNAVPAQFFVSFVSLWFILNDLLRFGHASDPVECDFHFIPGFDSKNQSRRLDAEAGHLDGRATTGFQRLILASHRNGKRHLVRHAREAEFAFAVETERAVGRLGALLQC